MRYDHPFWGSSSPLGGLAGGGLLIMASGRLAWAITLAGSLLWVNVLSVLAAAFLASEKCKNIFPARRKGLVLMCLSCFIGGLYIWLLWLFSPFAVMEVFLPLSLVPFFCVETRIFRQIVSGDTIEIREAAAGSAVDAAVLAGLLIIFSLIREPLGYNSLSLPGSYQGLIYIFSFNEGTFFPIRIIASCAGALLLLGYFTGLYNFFRADHAPKEGSK